MRIRRSAGRRRTLTLRRDGEDLLVMAPRGMDPREERRAVERLLARWSRSRGDRMGQDELMARAVALARAHLDAVVGSPVRPTSVRWVDNQEQRWGSCSVETGTVRVSRRVAGMPGWVLDHVILHELCHLVVPGHDKAFHALLDPTPRAAEAKAFLAGVSWARDHEDQPPGQGGQEWGQGDPTDR